MSTQHQDYLFRSRRKRLTRMFKLAGDTKEKTRRTTTSHSGVQEPPRITIGSPSIGDYEVKKSFSSWAFLLLPLIVIIAFFLNPFLGLTTSFLSLGAIGLFFWVSVRDNK